MPQLVAQILNAHYILVSKKIEDLKAKLKTLKPRGGIEMSQALYLLKITLEGCHVKIWRKFVVPSNLRLDQLHDVIQNVMGWQDGHLHEFVIDGESFGVPDPDDDWGDEEMQPEKKYRLDKVLAPGIDKFEYLYDFGDGWEHTIKVESLNHCDETGKVIFCLDGKGTCPPEDCGGSGGYADFCEAINNPKHPEHESMKEWIGDEETTWPDGFNLEGVNQYLAAYAETLPKSKKKAAKA